MKMKQAIFVSVLVIALAVANMAFGFKRLDVHEGTGTIEVENADSGRYISDNVLLNQYGPVKGYHILKYAFIVGAFDAESPDTSLPGKGNIDTALVKIIAQSNQWTETILDDTCTSLPCTLQGDYQYRAQQVDSTGGEIYQTMLLNDFLYLDIYCADSAGTGDTMSNTINWWLELVEE